LSRDISNHITSNLSWQTKLSTVGVPLLLNVPLVSAETHRRQYSNRSLSITTMERNHVTKKYHVTWAITSPQIYLNNHVTKKCHVPLAITSPQTTLGVPPALNDPLISAETHRRQYSNRSLSITTMERNHMTKKYHVTWAITSRQIYLNNHVTKNCHVTLAITSPQTCLYKQNCRRWYQQKHTGISWCLMLLNLS
jgi:hypothetical protein